MRMKGCINILKGSKQRSEERDKRTEGERKDKSSEKGDKMDKSVYDKRCRKRNNWMDCRRTDSVLLMILNI